MLQEKDVRRCFGALYHNASKDQHGTNITTGSVTIREDTWVANEQFCLAAIFTEFKVPWLIVDKQGDNVLLRFDMTSFHS